MNLPGFGADRYRKIAPYVTALPTATATINICTAPAIVLESLADNLSGEYSRNPELLTNGRKSGCFPDVQTFTNILGPNAAKLTKLYLGHELLFPAHHPRHAWHYAVHLVQSFVRGATAAR